MGKRATGSAKDPRLTSQNMSLFVQPWVYRVVLAIRSCCADACLTVLVFGFGVSWETVFNHAGLIIVPPAAIAGVLFIVVLRIGRDASRFELITPDGVRRAALAETLWPGGEPSLKLLVRTAVPYFAVILLAAYSLSKCPGGLIACYPPAIIALVLARGLRRRRSRRHAHQLRRPTEAGYRPSWRAMLSLRGRVALQNVDTAYPQASVISTNIADTAMDECAALFRRYRDHRSEAYSLARGIQYLLARNRISDAEIRSRAAMEDAHLSGQPAIMAVRAQCLAIVGTHADALQLLRAARRAQWRVPAQLDALILSTAIDSGYYDAAHQWRWSEWRRATMVWHRQVSAVILGLAADTRLLARSDPGNALKIAYQVCQLPDFLWKQLSPADFGVADYQRAMAGKGIVLDVAAGIYASRGEHPDASMAYSDAYDQFEAIGDRVRGCRSLINCLSSALAAGDVTLTREDHALDLIRVGLQLLEGDRGALRSEDGRASWVTSQRELYATVFKELTSVSYLDGKAGELGLWLLESLHRTMTADLMRRQGSLESDPELLAKLAELGQREYELRLANWRGREPGANDVSSQGQPDLTAAREEVRARLDALREAFLVVEPTDVEAALSRLGDRVALLYHCWREDAGWVIHSVLASSRHGIRVHRAQLDAASDAETISPLLTTAGALDAIHAGNPTDISFLFNVPLDEQLWRELAQALVPDCWWDVLCPLNGSLGDVLVVPDGPIASIPLAALPVRDGKMLIEYGSVALTPALDLLKPPVEPARPAAEGQRVAVVHLDRDSSLPAVAHERQHWISAGQHMYVVDTASQADIEAALHGPPLPDIVSISVHGSTGNDISGRNTRIFGTSVWLRDGSVLSATAALRLRWPPTVILGACWISAVSIGAGREPFGFPLSCLLRGATTVVGGIAPIPDNSTSHILGNLIDIFPVGGSVIPTLRAAQCDMLKNIPAEDLTPRQLCGLIVWTTEPARTQTHLAFPLYWDSQGIRRSEIMTTGRLEVDRLFSAATARVLKHAQHLADGPPINTLDFLAAAIAIDDTDWASFLIACEISEPVLPGPVNEAANGTVIVDLDGGRLVVTAALAKALICGQRATFLLHDETVLPAHVILASLCDDDTAAHRWLISHKNSATRAWSRHLGERIFGSDLPAPYHILGQDKTPLADPGHKERMTNSILAKPITYRAGPWKWILPAFVAAILLLLPLL